METVANKQKEAFDLLKKIVENMDSFVFENLNEYEQKLISEASTLVGSKNFRTVKAEESPISMLGSNRHESPSRWFGGPWYGYSMD